MPILESDLVGPVSEAGKGGDVTTLHAHARTVPTSTVGDIGEGSLNLAQTTISTNLSSKELAALTNIKSFCSGLLKKLAPPLLREIEVAASLGHFPGRVSDLGGIA